MNAFWGEWKEKCAFGLCGPETQGTLLAFAETRFRRYLRRAIPPSQVDALMQSPRNAWHLFETHLVTGTNRCGKSYKQWLFARAGGDAAVPDTIEGAAALLMRDVVREFIRREHSPAMMTSLDGLADAGFETDVSQLLPARLTPADETCWREQESQAIAEARDWVQQITDRERMALLGKAAGIPFSHDAMTRLAACGKSSLSTAYRDLVVRVGERTRKTHPDASQECHVRLSMITLNTLTARVLHWARHDEQMRDLIPPEREIA